MTVNPTQIIPRQLDAGYARRLALRHAGDGGGYREADATGPAARAAGHFGHCMDDSMMFFLIGGVQKVRSTRTLSGVEGC